MNSRPPGNESNMLTTELLGRGSVMVLILSNTNNPFPQDKILDLSKFKAFAEDKIDVSKKMNFVLGRVENIVGNGENAGYRHFLLFPQCFEKPVLPEP